MDESNFIRTRAIIIPGIAARGVNLRPSLLTMKITNNEPSEKPTAPPKDIMEFASPFLLAPTCLAVAAVGKVPECRLCEAVGDKVYRS